MRRPLGLVVAATGLLVIVASARADVQTTLKTPPFGWSDYGDFSGLSNVTVKEYRNTDGTADGKVMTTSYHIFDIDKDPDEKDPLVGGKEDIGVATFQFALWRGSSLVSGDTNIVGAAFLGGFQLTDLKDVGTSFSFLQIVTDNRTGTTVDGGGPQGKTNGDIPNYKADATSKDAGWNFMPGKTQYDYFDIPSIKNPASDYNASFETALVCYSVNKLGQTSAIILDDWRWGYSTDTNFNLKGTAVSENASASDALLNAYRKMFPTATYSNIGDASCHEAFAALPEPGTLATSGFCALILTGYGLIRRKRNSSRAA
jgi:hypothetical protein